MGCPQLVVGTDTWAYGERFATLSELLEPQDHKDKLPKRQHDQAKLMLRNIPYAESRSEAERMRDVFVRVESSTLI